MKKLLILIPLIFLDPELSKSQLPQVFQSWATTEGTQNYFVRSSLNSDPSGNVYVAGATINSAGNYDILVSKYDDKGELIWADQFDGPGAGNDMAAALAVDDSGNVFVTGTTFTSTADTLDAIVIAYDTAGSRRWVFTWAGTAGLPDAGSDILISNNSIYVGGFTSSPATMLDFLAIKLDWSGNLAWASTFDENGLDDLCTSILKIEGTKFFLAGGTRLTFTDWDYLTVIFDSDNGNPNVAETSSGGTAGFDRVMAIDKDGDGNIYLTGTAHNNSTGFDILTLKLDSNLTQIWSQTWSGTGYQGDGGMDIAVDASGDVWVGGYTSTATQGTDFILLKYNNFGNLSWAQTWAGDSASQDSLIALVIDNAGNAAACGITHFGGQSDFMTVKYLGTGDLKWAKRFHSPYNGNEIPCGIALDPTGKVIVTGSCETTGNSRATVTVSYEEVDLTRTRADSSGHAYFEEDAMIVRFREDAMIADHFSTAEEVSGEAEIFINAEVVSFIEAACEIEITSVKRLLPRLTPETTYSLSRGGDTVSMRGLWTTVKISYESDASEYEVRASLRSLDEYVMVADFNRIYLPQDIPDDAYYSQQKNLHYSPQYGNDANICAQEAWDLETGNLTVRVGVFDTGIDWTHPDFGGTVNYNADAFVNTIVDGWDYISAGSGEIWESLHRDQSYHGTSVAGIIGARRNNGIGVAGIAGGDWSQNQPGVSIYSFKVGSGLFWTEFVYPALIEGPAWNPQTGFGFGITMGNHSWSASEFDEFIHEGFVFGYENEVALIAARGNWFTEDEINLGIEETDPMYPACFEDEIVINTGASGTSGERKVEGNGNLSSPNDFNYFSMIGHGIDCIAPGTNSLVFSTADIQHDVTEYVGFSGTSAAAPHVTGLTGLMASYHNIQIPNTPNFSTYFAPEDYEYFVQGSCADRAGGGYDDFTGWGLVQACDLMEIIKSPEYYLDHVIGFGYDNLSLEEEDMLISLSFWPDLAPGNYFVDRYKVTKELTYVTPQGWNLLDYWLRASGSKGWDNSNMVNKRQIAHFESTPNQGIAEMSCYVYHVTMNQGGASIDEWIPHPPSHCEFEFSIYYETGLVDVTPAAAPSLDNITVFPVPSADQVTLLFPADPETPALFKIYNLTGSLLLQSEETIHSISQNRAGITYNFATFTPGTYLVSIHQNGRNYYGKIVIL